MTLLRVYRCWKCKREVPLTEELHREQSRRRWDCECGGSLHQHSLRREKPIIVPLYDADLNPINRDDDGAAGVRGG